MLVGDAHLDVGDLVMVIHLGSLGGKRVAGLGTMKEHDVVLDAEGESLMTVHDGGQRNVGQREIDAALTDASGIEMLGGDRQFGRGMAFMNVCETATAIGCETVVL